MLSRLFKSKNLKNSYWIIGEQVFQMLLSLLVGIWTARYLGPSNYGTLQYTAAYISFFINIAALGMEGVIIKEMIAHPNEEGTYLGSAIVFRLVAGLLSSIAIVILILLLNPGETLKLVLVLIQTTQFIFRSCNILDAWFQRRLQSKYVSIGKMAASIVVSGYKIFLLVTAQELVWFAFSYALTDFVLAAVLIYFYKKEGGQKLKYNYNKGMELLQGSYHFVLADLMSAIYGYSDRIMIGKMMTDADVGFYTTAATVSMMWLFVPNAIIKSFRPTIMEYKEKGDEQMYRRRLEQLMSSVFWLSVGVALVLTVLGELAIRLLYGEAYLPAAAPLVILVWSTVFAVTSMSRQIWILSENKNKYVKHFSFLGASLNVVLNLFLIPVWGIWGAAMATLVTEFLICVIAPFFFKDTNVLGCIVLRAITLKWYFNKHA